MAPSHRKRRATGKKKTNAPPESVSGNGSARQSRNDGRGWIFLLSVAVGVAAVALAIASAVSQYLSLRGLLGGLQQRPSIAELHPGIPVADLNHIPPPFQKYKYDPAILSGTARFHKGLSFNHHLRDFVRSYSPDVSNTSMHDAREADKKNGIALQESANEWVGEDLQSAVSKLLRSSPALSDDDRKRKAPPTLQRRGGDTSASDTSSKPATLQSTSSEHDDGLPSPTTEYQAFGGRCTIARRSGMTEEIFKTEYEFQKPVIFNASDFRSDVATQRILHQWSKSEILANHCHYNVQESSPLEFSNAKGGNQVSVCDYIRRMHGDNFENYVFQQGRGERPAADDDDSWANVSLGSLMRTFVPPPFIDYGINHGLTIGSSGTGTPLHFHGDGWNEVLYGQKRWFLFDIRKQPRFSEKGFLAQTIPDYDPSVPTLSWLLNMYASMSDDVRGGLYECIQGPNEVLYVPEGFLHATLNIGDTVAIAGQHLIGSSSVTSLTVAIDKAEGPISQKTTPEQVIENIKRRAEIVNLGLSSRRNLLFQRVGLACALVLPSCEAPGSDKVRNRLVKSLMRDQRIVDAMDQALYIIVALNHLYKPAYDLLFRVPGFCKPWLSSTFYNSPSSEVSARARACREAQLFGVSHGMIDGESLRPPGPKMPN